MKNFKEYVEEGSLNKMTTKFTHDQLNKKFKSIKKAYQFLEKYVSSSRFKKDIESYDEYQRKLLIDMFDKMSKNVVDGLQTKHIDYVPDSKTHKDRKDKQLSQPKKQKRRPQSFDW